MDGESLDSKRELSSLAKEDVIISNGSAQRVYASNFEQPVYSKRNFISQIISVDENDSQQDIYQYYLIDQSKKIRVLSSNNSRKSSVNENSMDLEEPVLKRYQSNSRLLAHECLCDDNNCLWHLCPCFNEIHESCVENDCCPNCIKLKNQKIQLRQSGKEANISLNNSKPPHQKCMCSYISKAMNNANFVCNCGNSYKNKNNLVPLQSKKSKGAQTHRTHKVTSGCSCKKSHCLKKYCCCYAAGKQCTSECQCQDCYNHLTHDQNRHETLDERQRVGNSNSQSQRDNELDIDQYLESQDYQNKMMPSSMQFQYPDLRNSYHL